MVKIVNKTQNYKHKYQNHVLKIFDIQIKIRLRFGMENSIIMHLRLM
jgi:hypothetical protein